MNVLFKKIWALSNFNKLCILIFLITIITVLGIPPRMAEDSFSYNVMEISRFPGFAIFMRIMLKLFGDYYTNLIVVFNIIFGCTALYYFTNSFKNYFKLKDWQSILLLILLIIPYYPKAMIANNIASESLAYPFYLIIICLSLELLLFSKFKNVLYLVGFLILLNLTRGQFIILPFIICFLFILKEFKNLRKKTHLKVILLLLIVPFATNLLDKSYRKLVHGHFEKTPYSFVNAVALPLFVSEKDDFKTLKDEDYKNIFKFSYQRIDSLGLLNHKVQGSLKDKYWAFHDNFPLICNQNIHMGGVDYYMSKGFTRAEGYIKTEQACKAILFNSLEHNLTDYLKLYFTSIVHGFKSVYLFLLVLILALWSFIKTIKKYEPDIAFILFTTLLILSNAFIVAVACHSISRYLFYNYFALIMIPILLSRRLFNYYKTKRPIN
jgi:hypothetical protein